MIPATKLKKFIWPAAITVFLALAYFLLSIFRGHLILPQFFTIGPFRIYYYGIIMAMAILAGYVLAKKRARRYGIESKIADDLMFWVIIGGFAGARIYHLLSSFGYYRQHLLDAFKIWNGGLSIFGAVLGGIIALFLYHKIFNLKSHLLNYLDWLAPSVVLGQIVGRFGNLFNYEAFGYPTNLPWKMYIPQMFRPEMFGHFSFFHPLFLYEALGNLAILFILLKFAKNLRPGALFFIYLLLYNILRFSLEFMRVDSTFVGTVRLNSIASFILASISLIFLLIMGNLKSKTPYSP
jgi:phosphatidylglycerol---prolipoprotein diacylglyceryl transferase